MVRGPWITSGYFKGDGGEILDADGFFDTGDVATIDADGYMQITDRVEGRHQVGRRVDLVDRSRERGDGASRGGRGGGHRRRAPQMAGAAAADRGEEDGPGRDARRAARSILEGKVAKWWLPDDVVFVDELPHTATGKLQKMKLREQFRSYQFPTA